MKIFDYIFASRPLLHLPVWSVYFVTLHYHLQATQSDFSIINLLVVVSLSLATSATYFINQIYDYESDKINNKLGFLQKDYISFSEMKTLYYICAIVSISLAFYISNNAGFLVTLFVLMGAIYSVPPFRLKDRPFLGLLSNAIGYGAIIPLTVMPEMNLHNNGFFRWDLPVYFMLTIGAIYILTTIPDIEGDIKTGKRTLAIIFPPPMLKLLALILLIDSVIIAYSSNLLLLQIISVLSIIIVLVSILNKSEKFLFLSIKLPILLLTLLAGYFFYIYFIFIVALIIGTRLYYKKRFNMEYPKLT